MRISLLLLLVAIPVAHADPAADASKAFTAFVASVATAPATTGLGLFVTPFADGQPVPSDLGPLQQLLEKPRVKTTHVAVSRSGKSAWLVGEVTARVPRGDKRKTEALRASALLGLGRDGWHVQATQWSATVPNRPGERCGMLREEPRFASDVPKVLAAPVQEVIAAFRAMPAVEGGPFGGDRTPLLQLISEAPGAVVLGSAAGERFVGGKAIKALFKKWNITSGGGTGDVPARAGAGPDGELMWMYTTTTSNAQCTEYRTFLVLAKEPAGWRLVHQHFSEHITAP